MNKFVRHVFILLCMAQQVSAEFVFDTAVMMQEFQGGGGRSTLAEDSSSQGSDVLLAGGNADTLLNAAGEKSEEMKSRERWFPFKGTWYWPHDPLEEIVGEKCDSDGKNCVDVKAAPPTPQQTVDKRVARIKGILASYALKGENAVNELSKDMKALQDEINQLSVRKLTTSGENLKTELQRILEAAQAVKSMMSKELDKKLFKESLQDYLPSKGYILEESLKDLDKKIELFSRDKAMRLVYEKVKDYLHKIARLVESLKRVHDSLEEAQNEAKEKLKRLEDPNKFSRVLSQAQEDEIALYKEVIAELGLEMKDEEKLEGKRAVYEEEAKGTISSTYKYTLQLDKYATVEDFRQEQEFVEIALEEAKRDLLQREKELSKLTVGSLRKKKKEEIEKQEIIIELLEKALREVKDANSSQQRKIDELIRKYGGIKQAIDYLSNSGKSLPNAEHMKKLLEKRQEQAEKDAIANDPFNKAIEALSKAKAAEVPKALENVIAALLAKGGVTMDKIDVAKRQELAVILKNSSDQLIIIIQNPRLTEQQKQLQKQIVVKGMLKDAYTLLASYLTGASAATIASGKLLPIGIEIATNKLINALAPQGVAQSTADFDLGAFTKPSVDSKKQAAYKELGLQPGATRQEVRQAYRDLARITHPDKRPAADKEKATAEFQVLQNAYDYLMQELDA